VKSIRFYLVAALLSTVTLGNFVAAVYGYRSAMRETQDLLDLQLADTAALLEAAGAATTGVVNPATPRMAFQVWSASGRLLARSANSGAQPITDFTAGYRDENFEGYRWRVLAQSDDAGARWILVAERIDIRNQLADGITLSAVMPIIVSLVLIAAIAWFVVGNGLSLITRLARELRDKRADDLSKLTTSNTPVELVPVVDAINDLLRRLNESVVRERRFSADAAHELRTPISAIKVHIHNLRAEMPEQEQTLQTLDRDLARLSHLIEQIMLLYRMTPENYQAKMRQLDLRELAQTVISDLYAEIDIRGQTISLEGSQQSITGDEASLIILLRNLVMNASKYSPDGASIRVHVDRGDFGVWLGVEDTGPGIPLQDISRIFDRFYRVGGDRHSSHVEGCGLGLAIVKHIADLHRATLHAENNAQSSGLTVSITFPDDIESPLYIQDEPA